MKLGEFIKQFIRPNSVIRLVYQEKGGHRLVLDTYFDVSMEWEILKGKGVNRHFINNEVIGVTDILFHGSYSEAINIVIGKLDNQPFIEEKEELFYETLSEQEVVEKEVVEEEEVDNKSYYEKQKKTNEDTFFDSSYWVGNEWVQPPVRIKHGDLVDITYGSNDWTTVTGRYIGKGMGVAFINGEYYINKVKNRGLDKNPTLVSDQELFNFIKD